MAFCRRGGFRPEFAAMLMERNGERDRAKAVSMLDKSLAISGTGPIGMEAQTLTFTMERETKNTVRYQEQTEGKPPAIGALYVQKWALGETLPQTITVTVAEG